MIADKAELSVPSDHGEEHGGSYEGDGVTEEGIEAQDSNSGRVEARGCCGDIA